MQAWIISANKKYYDFVTAFKDCIEIDWRQNCNCSIGDIVYIYSTIPYKKIMYKTHVEKINMDFSEIRDDSKYWVDKNEYRRVDGRKYMRLVLDEKYDDENLSLEKLHTHGLNGNIQGPRRLADETLEYIVSCTESNVIYPETDVPKEFWEGSCIEVKVNKYERDPKARAECIKEWGCKCVVCGLDFEEMYGEIGKGFIHVHHIKEISKMGAEHKVDPKKDLIPVCPNCHAMLHRKINGKTLSYEELQKIVRKK